MPTIKRWLRLLLLLVLGYLLLANFVKSKKLDQLAAQSGGLADGLSASVVLTPGKLISTTRTDDGKITAQVKYVPPEGRAEITQDLAGNLSVNVKRAGFTFRPAVVGMLAKEPKIGLGARLLYFGRYGAGAGLNQDFEPFLFADRRVDDFTGFLHNTTIGVYGSRDRIGIMTAVYF